MITIEELKNKIYDGTLQDFLSTCNVEELKKYLDTIENKKEINDAEKIYLHEIIVNEIGYQNIIKASHNNLDKAKIREMVNKYSGLIGQIPYADIIESFNYYRRGNIDYEKIICSAPVFLSINTCYQLYNSSINQLDQKKIQYWLLNNDNFKVFVEIVVGKPETSNTDYTDLLFEIFILQMIENVNKIDENNNSKQL